LASSIRADTALDLLSAIPVAPPMLHRCKVSLSEDGVGFQSICSERRQQQCPKQICSASGGESTTDPALDHLAISRLTLPITLPRIFRTAERRFSLLPLVRSWLGSGRSDIPTGRDILVASESYSEHSQPRLRQVKIDSCRLSYTNRPINSPNGYQSGRKKTYMSTLFIGLPVYNGENYLGKAIDSILKQTFADFTLLIADNASTDNTGDIARCYASRDTRIRYHRHDTNLGAAPNFNYCVAEASGKYFKWMAYDDLLEPTYLESCVAYLDQHKDAVLCHSLVTRIDETGGETGPYSDELDFDGDDPADRFGRAMAFNHSCVSVFGVIRLDALRRTKLIASYIGSDRALLADLALSGKLANVTEPLFLWRNHEKQSILAHGRQELIQWFDANIDIYDIRSYLFTTYMFDCQSIILHSSQPAGVKIRGLWKTVRWAVQNRAFIFGDARRVVGMLFRRVRRWAAKT
jgi:glycosyltransferase involved in cell wall biosynthesis